MRKFLHQKFWSHGTPLGSLGPLSQQDIILGFDIGMLLDPWPKKKGAPVTPGVSPGTKIFLISSSNELILWVLWIGYAKIGKNQEKLLIFGHFHHFLLL